MPPAENALFGMNVAHTTETPTAHLQPLAGPGIPRIRPGACEKYGPGAAMAWGPLARRIPLDPDPKLAVVTSQGVLLCGTKWAGSYRGWGARDIGSQKPGRRRATTPPPMTVDTWRAAAMQDPLKQCT